MRIRLGSGDSPRPRRVNRFVTFRVTRLRSGSSLRRAKRHQARFSQTLQDPVRDRRGGHFAGARDRRERGDLLPLRPDCWALPVQEPARLVNLSALSPKPGSQSCGQAGECDDVFSYPMFMIWSAPRRSSPALPLTSARRQPFLPGSDAKRRGLLVSGRTFRCSGCGSRSAGCSTTATIATSAVTSWWC